MSSNTSNDVFPSEMKQKVGMFFTPYLLEITGKSSMSILTNDMDECALLSCSNIGDIFLKSLREDRFMSEI